MARFFRWSFLGVLLSLFIFLTISDVRAARYCDPITTNCISGSGGNVTGCGPGDNYQISDLSVCQALLGYSYKNTCCTQSGCSAADGTSLNQWDWNYATGCKAVYSGYQNSCSVSYEYTTNTCGATDSCGYTPPSTLNGGLCNSNGCAVGGPYKACCQSSGASAGELAPFCAGGQFTGSCGSYTPVQYGPGSQNPQFSTPEQACASLAPPPPATKYGCSGAFGACQVDSSGSYTDSSCNGQCPGCPLGYTGTPPNCTASPVSCNLTVDGTSSVTVDPGAGIQLAWTSQGADSCSASGAWSGSYGTNGNQILTASSTPGTYTYNLYCANSATGASNLNSPCSATVNVGAGQTCPAGQTGTPPNCTTPPPSGGSCPPGQVGTPPNCGARGSCPVMQVCIDSTNYVLMSGYGTSYGTCSLGTTCQNNWINTIWGMCPISSCVGTGSINITGRVFSDASGSGNSSGQADYPGGYTINVSTSNAPYQPSYCAGSWMANFNLCMAQMMAWGSSYSTAYASCIVCQYPPASSAPTYCWGGNYNSCASHCTSNSSDCPNNSTQYVQYRNYYGQTYYFPYQTYCSSACPQGSACSYYGGSYANCLYYTGGRTDICGPGCTGVASPPPLNVSKSGSSFTIGSSGGNIPWANYTVSIKDANGSPLSITEPGSGTFAIRAGYYCPADDITSSKNAQCSAGNIQKLDFGISQPPDIQVSFKSANKSNFNVGEQASFTYTVTNPSSRNSVTTAVGFWPTGSTGTNPMPNCPTTSGTPVNSPAPQTITVAPLSSQDVTFSFNATTGSTAYAYASYSCNPADSNWANNSAGKSYTVNSPAWFEGIGGDTGSQGAISVTQAPPAGHYQSSFLVAGNGISATVQTQKWKINNYTNPLVPTGGVYIYLAERFLQTAKNTGGNGCQISAGNHNGFYYCSGDATYNSGNGPNGKGVWFIDGNLTITKDLVLGAGDTVTFIVKGNITVSTSVKRIDGIYIAGGVFNDFDSSGNYGVQLVVNGGVYVQSVNLARKLGGTACPSGVQCDNTQTAADQFNFDPKYLVGLNNILGTPAISWKELAP